MGVSICLINFSILFLSSVYILGMYGRSSKSSRSWGSGRPRASRKPYRNLLKVGAYPKGRTTYMKSPKFATVGFARNVEKKYFDKTYQANTSETMTGQTAPVLKNNGVTYISNTWGEL